MPTPVPWLDLRGGSLSTCRIAGTTPADDDQQSDADKDERELDVEVRVVAVGAGVLHEDRDARHRAQDEAEPRRSDTSSAAG